MAETITVTNIHFAYDLYGKAFISFNTADGKIPEATKNISPNKLYEMTIKEHKEKRSLDANAYAWVLIDKLAEKLKVSKSEIYREAIREIGGNSETVCVLDSGVDKLIANWKRNGLGWQAEVHTSKIEGCTNVTLFYGSSTYDTKQMSRLIDLIVNECKDFGIETMTPMELERIKQEWH